VANQGSISLLQIPKIKLSNAVQAACTVHCTNGCFGNNFLLVIVSVSVRLSDVQMCDIMFITYARQFLLYYLSFCLFIIPDSSV